MYSFLPKHNTSNHFPLLFDVFAFPIIPCLGGGTRVKSIATAPNIRRSVCFEFPFTSIKDMFPFKITNNVSLQSFGKNKSLPFLTLRNVIALIMTVISFFLKCANAGMDFFNQPICVFKVACPTFSLP